MRPSERKQVINSDTRIVNENTRNRDQPPYGHPTESEQPDPPMDMLFCDEAQNDRNGQHNDQAYQLSQIIIEALHD
jgi:hypothetical protein